MLVCHVADARAKKYGLDPVLTLETIQDRNAAQVGVCTTSSQVFRESVRNAPVHDWHRAINANRGGRNALPCTFSPIEVYSRICTVKLVVK